MLESQEAWPARPAALTASAARPGRFPPPPPPPPSRPPGSPARPCLGCCCRRRLARPSRGRAGSDGRPEAGRGGAWRLDAPGGGRGHEASQIPGCGQRAPSPGGQTGQPRRRTGAAAKTPGCGCGMGADTQPRGTDGETDGWGVGSVIPAPEAELRVDGTPSLQWMAGETEAWVARKEADIRFRGRGQMK